MISEILDESLGGRHLVVGGLGTDEEKGVLCKHTVQTGGAPLGRVCKLGPKKSCV